MAIRKSLLPSAYQQVEYIESSGTQYIDTGYIPSDTSGFEIKITSNDMQNDRAYFGVRESTTTNSRFTLGSANQTFYVGYNSLFYFTLNGSRTTYQANTTHVLSLNKNSTKKFIIDGIESEEEPTNETLVNQTKSIYVFCANWAGSPNYYQNYKLHWLKLYNSGNLVRHFIPCYRKSDSVIGLYDLVNGVFYTNAGSGTFTKGNDITPKVKHIVKPMALPNTYQRVEYIESTGTQFIDSGFNAKDGFKIQMSFIITSLSNRSVPFGYNGSSQESFFRVNANGSAAFWANTIGGVVDNLTISTNTKYDIECLFDSSAYLKVNGETKMSMTTTKSYYNGNIPILCCGNIGGLNNDYALAKLYSCKIYNLSGTLARDLIPCYRKADDVAGLYDLVNNVFYTNQGTGTFNVGSDISNAKRIIKQYKGTSLYFYDVPSIYQRVEYIEATGTQYINTGIETSYDEWNMYLTFQRGATMGGTIFGATGGFEVYLESSQPNYKAQNTTSSVQAQVGTFNDIKLRPLPVANGIIMLTVDGSTNTQGGVVYSYGNTIGLCGRGDGTNLIAGLFGEFKVQKGTKTLIHLLPCYRKSDNVVGMYDVISGQFFTNNGTGTFGKGADL